MNAQSNFQEQAPEVGSYDLQILLAYDGSTHAQAALNLLRDLSIGQECQVTALAVMPTQYIGGHEALQDSLNRAEGRLREKGISTTSMIRAGNPAASINAQAQEIKATQGRMDLIVVGAKGLRATLGILLGGVAQAVVEYSCCPVLVVRAPYEGIKRVLLVTDGSPFSQQALEYLAPPASIIQPRRLPLPKDVDVDVMHVLPPSIPPELAMRAWTVGPEVIYPAPPVDTKALEADEEAEGQRILKNALASLKAGGIQASSVLKRGDAATEIIEYARENHIDLIVCGSRGLSAVSGWLLGSVSRKLVHYAGCSVLIVKSGEG